MVKAVLIVGHEDNDPLPCLDQFSQGGPIIRVHSMIQVISKMLLELRGNVRSVYPGIPIIVAKFNGNDLKGILLKELTDLAKGIRELLS